MSTAFSEALAQVFQPQTLAAILLAAVYGIFVGAIPGLTATMAVALAVSVVYHLDTVTALAVIVTLEATAIFAGDIPSTLVRIPGTPASAAYTDDAFELSRRGEGSVCLGVSLVFSVFGGLFGSLALMLMAPGLAGLARNFTSFEYFWLALLGLSSAAVVSRGSVLKGTFSLLLGLLISSIGLDEIHGEKRLTFGLTELVGGINYIPAMIGLFGVAEVLRNLSHGEVKILAHSQAARGILTGALRLLRRRLRRALLASGIGTVIGALPGAGADIAAWISFAASKRASATPELYGKGSLEGVGDATAANNAALAGAWVPALVFGIPGDSVTAIVLGVMMLKNVQPGWQIFESQPDLVYSLYMTFILANLILIPVGYLAVRAGGLIVRLPRAYLLPAILLFSIVGSFAINGSLFDVLVMLVMGILGFVLERHGFPVGPVVLGIVLGPMVEKNLMISLNKSAGGFGEFFLRPYAGALGAVTIAIWTLPLLARWWKRRRDEG